MNIDKEVEDFRNNLELLKETGAEKVAWVAVDANRDKISQINSIRFLKNIFPDILLFASKADTDEELVADIEGYLAEIKSRLGLKVAKDKSAEFGLHLGV